MENSNTNDYEKNIIDDLDDSIDEEDSKRLNLPKKNKYRMRAHCNPLAEISIPYPISPKCVDWSKHYPSYYNKSTKENSEIHNNTNKYPITYTFDGLNESTSEIPNKLKIFKCVNILDVGCGYGGLLYNMAPFLEQEDLALGMEIRDKVTNFVGEKIKTLRINSGHKHVKNNNISVVRTNSMKLILNYFYKEQLDKIFFCFPDPHFKKYNHRKRVINNYLLNDYAHILKFGGKLYTITDVEDLFKWHVETLNAHPCFRALNDKETEGDKFLDFMRNTDEARKVQKKNGGMFIAVYERVMPLINSVEDLFKI